MGTNVLIIGSGGREHALGWKIAQSPHIGKLFFSPGNAGTAEIGENIENLPPPPYTGETLGEIESRLSRHGINFVVIGPEVPLVAGLADAIRHMGIPVFGPSAKAAQLEASKLFAKRFMGDAWVPTSPWRAFGRKEAYSAQAFVRKHTENGTLIVIKADGLEAGKGVTVPASLKKAEETLEDFGKNGCSGDVVVIEERQEGYELSLHYLSDGERGEMLSPIADEKLASAAPNAPMTGGMGAYGPVPWVSQYEMELYEDLFVKRMLPYLEACGRKFIGCLYPGIMVTPNRGPVLLEYNVRFGDPEAQVLMLLLKQSDSVDFLSVLMACAKGSWNPHMMGLRYNSGCVVCVTLAAKGYPGDVSAVQGALIKGIAEAEKVDGVKVFHAGTARNDDGELVVNGGRVLSVTAIANTFREARERVHEAVSYITFGDKDNNLVIFRDDIANKAIAWEADHIARETMIRPKY